MELSTGFETLKREQDDLIDSAKLAPLGSIATGVAQLIERFAAGAVDLVTRFKRRVVDRVSERRGQFDLREVADDVIAALRPALGELRITIQNRIPPGVVCDNFTEPMGQTLASVIQNAVMHGFDISGGGTVGLDVVPRGERIILAVRDDCNGMDTATLTHIVEPFLTTPPGKGSDGPGLTLRHRIASTILGCEIHATSVAGQGRCFTINMLRSAPGKV